MSEPEYIFLPQIAFESDEAKEEIRNRGLLKVDEEAIQWGVRFRDKIEASYIPKVSVRFLGEMVGYGLFAEEDLVPGVYVGEYTGIVRRDDMRRYSEVLNNYCFKYPVTDFIGREHVIDATQGHLTRFINHSEKPNLNPHYAYIDGLYHLIFISSKFIAKGTQLTYNYGHNYWYVREKPVSTQS